jgi:hypothetical protein
MESSIIFFGFDSGRAKISAFSYSITGKINDTIRLTLTTDINWPSPALPASCILSIGTFQRIRELLNTPYLFTLKPVDEIRYLIHAQSEASSNVGGPVDILQIDRTGIVFKGMKESCTL